MKLRNTSNVYELNWQTIFSFQKSKSAFKVQILKDLNKQSLKILRISKFFVVNIRNVDVSKHVMFERARSGFKRHFLSTTFQSVKLISINNSYLKLHYGTWAESLKSAKKTYLNGPLLSCNCFRYAKVS